MTEAVDFELKLERTDHSQYRVVLLRIEDLGGDSAEYVEATLTKFTDDFFQSLLEHSLDHAKIGQLLLKSLIPAELNDALQRALGRSLGSGQGLRLRLRIDLDRPELQRIPWERALLGFDQAFGSATKIAFSRYLSTSNQRLHKLRPRAPLRILVATASPKNLPGLPAIDATTELERVRHALGSQTPTVGLPPTAQSTLDHLREALGRHVDGDVTDVLCLVAHGEFRQNQQGGERAVLLLEGTDGSLENVPAEHLIELLQQAPELPRLVILGSCESAGNGFEDTLRSLGAQLVQIGIPAVVAMQGRITVPTFETFLHTFLRKLNHSGHADLAMAEARAAIRAYADWWMPVLFQRTRQGRIWAEDDAELRRTVMQWLHRQPSVPAPEARERLAQAILGCQVVRDLDWQELSGLDVLLDEIEAYPADAPAFTNLMHTIAEVLPTGGVSYQDARALRQILREVRLFSGDLRDLYGRIKPRGNSWQPPVFDDQPGRLAAIVSNLAWAPLDPDRGLAPLVLLVDELLRHYVSGDVAKVQDQLGAWRATVAPHQPPTQALLPTPPRDAYLQIQLREGRSAKLTGQARFSCVAWLCYADDNPDRPQSRQFGDLHMQYEREQLPSVFRTLVREAMRELASGTQEIRLEVFVPRSLMLMEIDQWDVDHGTGQSMKAGMKYQLVVRAIERVEGSQGSNERPDWHRKGQGLHRWCNEPACTYLYWIEHADSGDQDELFGQLYDDDRLGVSQIWHPAAPDQGQALLDSVLGMGVPVALIVRPSADPTIPPIDRTTLEANLQPITLGTLPATISTWRRRQRTSPTQLGRRLTLLWDDPQRLPPSIQYTNTEE